MSVRLSGSILCAACFCEDPSKLHVDFDAGIDRGYGPSGEIPCDDVILCEDCVRAGGSEIGLIDEKLDEQERSDMQVRIDRLERELRQARTFADNLESAFETRPKHGPITLDHRKRPRQVKEPVHE